MFYKQNQNGYRQGPPGVLFKTLTYGEKTLLTEFKMQANYELPRHSHPHEQTGYLVSGRIRLTIGEETFDVEPGDSWSVPGNMEHQVDILQDSLAIEVFSPVREEYLPDEARQK